MVKQQTNTEDLPLFAQGSTPVQKERQKEQDPATRVMKEVAKRAPDHRRMAKDFTPEEIEDIMFKRQDGDPLTKEETRALRDRYRRMKRWAMEKEKTNNQQIICVPCIMDDKGFYKVFEVSALYYVYRLADRMQRSA